MTFWAIVPVKPLRRGKSRLAGVLSEDERTALNHYLLAHTLDVLTGTAGIEQVLVVSRDPAALALAREHGARTVMEHGAPKLNVALTRATLVLHEYSVQGVLVMPADLPLVTNEDVTAMLSLAQDPPVVVIAPDRHRDGTNALLIHPIGQIDYHFGIGSFERHCQLALKAGVRLEICERSNLALDVDVPEDLKLAGLELSIYHSK